MTNIYSLNTSEVSKTTTCISEDSQQIAEIGFFSTLFQLPDILSSTSDEEGCSDLDDDCKGNSVCSEGFEQQGGCIADCKGGGWIACCEADDEECVSDPGIQDY